MKTQHLHDIWSSADNSRLVSKQFSFRLPVHIAAKIAALCDLYPQKNRTQIVADLLSAALDDLEKNLPMNIVPVNEFQQQYEDEQSYHAGLPQESLFEMGGARAQFRHKSNQHYKDLEKELGNDSPSDLFEYKCGSHEYIESLYK
ncbi:hypothetical protein [Methylotenera sp. G11]|uniref:hypothetical protein n=1 Tax=Methylotenera sp. G11 TaxID=1506585 RepID=UPI00068C9DD0|nr:hypothetical protein [Methylotenera sp. G11]